jgi:hypothetical protein
MQARDLDAILIARVSIRNSVIGERRVVMGTTAHSVGMLNVGEVAAIVAAVEAGKRHPLRRPNPREVLRRAVGFRFRMTILIGCKPSDYPQQTQTEDSRLKFHRKNLQGIASHSF